MLVFDQELTFVRVEQEVAAGCTPVVPEDERAEEYRDERHHNGPG
ncbi:hypothetical protein [Amycolatopsis sp. cmx-4-83]